MASIKVNITDEVIMKVYLEDIFEAEAAAIRARNEYLRERGWKEQRNQFKEGLIWGKTIYLKNNNSELEATMLTTEEALDVEKTFNKTDLHRKC